MKFFLDTEFLEDGRTIELISIGIVAEDDREYYAETCSAHVTRQVYELHKEIGMRQINTLGFRIMQHPWLMENVIPHLDNWPNPLGIGDPNSPIKLQTQIREEITDFTRCSGSDEPEFWAHCGAYDWY